MKEILLKALSQFGVTEIKGEEDNPVILSYFKQIGKDWVKDDETAWCSAFINWCAKTCGYEYTGRLDARSWEKVGEEVLNPEIGDIVVLWRGAHKDERISGSALKKGHVGIYIAENKNFIYVLGGNQSNMVKISTYSKSRLLSYRRLKRLNN